MNRILVFCIPVMLGVNLAFGQCPAGQTQVTVTITPDNYGSETTWSLTGFGGTPVFATGGPYSNGNSNPVTMNACVLNGNVVFSIFDSFGDGICCANGNGSYSVSSGGNTILSGGQFASSEVSLFMVPPALYDVAVTNISTPRYLTIGTTNVRGTIKNMGTAAISDVLLNYSVDSGFPVSQIFSGIALQPFSTYDFSFNIAWNPASTGYRNLKVTVVNIDGNLDQNPVNDYLIKSIFISEYHDRKQALIETFTSSTCIPCVPEDAGIALLMQSNSGNIAPIQYHMNWPAPGADPMHVFNVADNNSRRGYYGIQNLPNARLAGTLYGGATQGITQTHVDEEISNPGLFRFELFETKSGNDIQIMVKATSLIKFNSGNPRLHVVLVEAPVNYTIAPGPSGETNFRYVMRKMFPDAQGTSLILPDYLESNTVSFSYTSDTSIIIPLNLKTVLFVQDEFSKEIFQAGLAPLPSGTNDYWVTGIQNLTISSSNQLKIFPNPVRKGQSLKIKPEKDGVLILKNMLGQTLFSSAINKDYELSTSGLSDGIYLVSLIQHGISSTAKLMVIE